MTVPSSKEWRHLFHQAREIASQLEQELTSAHVLLSLFLMQNKAESLLLDRGITEDAILTNINVITEEPPNTLLLITQRSQEIASRTNSEQIDSLHLLIAMSRVTCSMAYQLLQRCDVSLPILRNQATSYLAGRVRRRFDTMSDNTSGVHEQAMSYDSHGAVEGSHIRELSYSDDTVQRELPNTSSPPVAADTHTDMVFDSHGELDGQRFPFLAKNGINLTKKAREGRCDPLIGREKELDEMIDILGKRRANNPCLVGPPGVGKTALVEGLAMFLAHTNVPGLSSKIVIELEMSGLVAGTQLRGSLAERLQTIKDEVRAANGQIIVFIDEIHTLVRAGATGEGAQDAANDLKAALGRGEFPCIGATTDQDYKTYIETDKALVRRFHTIQVAEPTIEETYRIIDGVAPRYAGHHRVTYLPEALRAAVRLSARFLHDRRLPTKAIDILDTAGSRASRSGITQIGRAEVAKVIAQLASVPEEHLVLEDRQRLLNMEDILNKRVIGHHHILKEIASAIRRNHAGFNGDRPIGSFLYLGPPGVGKTETAKAIASFLFHNDHAMMRVDMSEYQDASSVTRLIGAPPGYIGHDDGGQLTEAIRSKPYQLILLDEIEKAHRDVLMLLLQLLDEGVLTDGKGRRVSFSQCVIVMTSNLGSECCEAYSRPSIGFSSNATQTRDDLEQLILEEARKELPIELWNRIDERLVFTPLDIHEVRDIARLMVLQSSKRLRDERNIAYVVTEAVLDWVIDQGGYHPRWGARPMRAIIQRKLEASLAELILEGRVRPGARLEAEIDAHNQLHWRLLSVPEVASTPPKRLPQIHMTPAHGVPRYQPGLSEEDEDLLALPIFEVDER